MAAKSYENNPTALHLRAMNMLYEGLKTGNATIILVPSTALESMNLGAMTGITALAKTLTNEQKDPMDREQPPSQ